MVSSAKGKILLIDDDNKFLNLAHEQLQEAGYEISLASGGKFGLKELYAFHPHLILLDLDLPDMDGWEVFQRIREITDIPVIMLTYVRQKSDLLKGFSLGADDFVIKPPDFPELIARIGAVLRRYAPSVQDEKPAVFRFMDFEIDWRSHQVLVQGKTVKLSPTEYKLLSCLVENRGWLMTHGELLRKVWGPDYISDKPFVKLYIRYLRQKIEKDPGQPQLILTERGIGYRFATEIRELV